MNTRRGGWLGVILEAGCHGVLYHFIRVSPSLCLALQLVYCSHPLALLPYFPFTPHTAKSSLGVFVITGPLAPSSHFTGEKMALAEDICNMVEWKDHEEWGHSGLDSQILHLQAIVIVDMLLFILPLQVPDSGNGGSKTRLVELL